MHRYCNASHYSCIHLSWGGYGHQEQIREGVERADNALLKYEVKDKSMVRLEQAAEAARPHSAHQTPLPDDIEHIVPAAEKMAQLRY